MTKYNSKTKEGQCLFCEIAKGNIQTPGIFWEDSNFMAFLSIFPNTKGFSVVIPKKHFDSDVLAMQDKTLTEFVLAAKKVSNILLKTFKDVGRVGLIMEGTGIDHAHIKLVPMHGTEHMKEGIWKQYASGRSDYIEKYSGYLISSDGPQANTEELKQIAEELRRNS